jgi:hypothetical protein
MVANIDASDKGKLRDGNRLAQYMILSLFSFTVRFISEAVKQVRAEEQISITGSCKNSVRVRNEAYL